MGNIVDFPKAISPTAGRNGIAMVDLKRVLHVDDDEDIRSIAKLSLELVGGFEVTQFGSAHEALAAAEQCEPQLLLLDVMMPKMSGQELWRKLRRFPKFKRVPVVFFTAKADKKFRKKLLHEGAAGVIVKPFDPETLCSSLEEIWQRSRSAT